MVLQRHEGRDLLNAIALITWPGLAYMAVGGGAMLLGMRHLRRAAFRGETQPSLSDFRITFVMVGVAGVLSALFRRQLAADAGAKVSGNQPR